MADEHIDPLLADRQIDPLHLPGRLDPQKLPVELDITHRHPPLTSKTCPQR